MIGYIRKVSNDREIVQDGDPAEYRQLVKSTILAVPRDQSATPPFKPSHTQWFTLKEIINRVIEHFCRLNKSNVLAFGFETLKANDKGGTVAGTVGLQNSYPNTIVSYLRTAKAWQLLHERIGDDLMIHLLQNVAVFVKVSSKCYFQVAGFPISRLTPLTAKDVPQTLKLQDIKQGEQPPSDGDHANQIKRKIRRGGKRVRRSRQNFPIQKENDLTECVGVAGTTSATSAGVVSKEGSLNVECDTVQASASSSEIITVNQQDQPKCRKRRASSSVTDIQEGPCAKKARTCSSFTEVSPSLFPVEDDIKEKVAAKRTSTCRRKPWKYLLKLLPKSEHSKSSPEEGPVRKHQEKCPRKRRKRIQANNGKGHLASKKKSEGIQLNEIYLPHSRLFHSSNLSQAFPKKHVMQTTPVSMCGARKLVHHIFLKGSCLVSKNVAGASSSQKQIPRRERKPFRLPRRLKRIQPILLKFLARHKKCPFRTLLRHHCFYACNSKERRKQARCTSRVKKSLKKGGLARIILNVTKRRVPLKHPWKKGQSKVSKHANHKKKAKVDVSMHHHAVKSFTRQDQVCTCTCTVYK